MYPSIFRHTPSNLTITDNQARMGTSPTWTAPGCDPELEERVRAWALGVPPDAGSGASTSSESDRALYTAGQHQGPLQYIDDSGRLRLSSVQEQSREQLGQFSASEFQADRTENNPGVEPGPAENNTQRYSRTGMTDSHAHNPGERTKYQSEQMQSRLNLLADEFEEPGTPVQQSTTVEQKPGNNKSRRRAFFERMKEGLRKLRK